jgi:hypothetical protein
VVRRLVSTRHISEFGKKFPTIVIPTTRRPCSTTPTYSRSQCRRSVAVIPSTLLTSAARSGKLYWGHVHHQFKRHLGPLRTGSHTGNITVLEAGCYDRAVGVCKSHSFSGTPYDILLEAQLIHHSLPWSTNTLCRVEEWARRDTVVEDPKGGSKNVCPSGIS